MFELETRNSKRNKMLYRIKMKKLSPLVDRFFIGAEYLVNGQFSERSRWSEKLLVIHLLAGALRLVGFERLLVQEPLAVALHSLSPVS